MSAKPIDESVSKRARDTALAAAAEITAEPTSLVSFKSAGRLLIIGSYAKALAAAQQLGQQSDSPLVCAILASEANPAQNNASTDQFSVPVLYAGAGRIIIGGHLGEFKVTVVTDQGELNIARALDRKLSHFDLLLDLSTKPYLQMEMLPLGYYAPGADEAGLERALQELPDLVGEFDKAKFFHYDENICAHGNSGLSGCSRCIQACPTDAIKSLADLIEIDPYLCQGGGSCATACPSGAITYSYPRPADMENRLRVLLRVFRENGGNNAVLLFHDSENASVHLHSIAATLPASIIPIEVEEIGSVGMDIWLAGLAYGAAQVLLFDTPEVASSVRRELEQQLTITRALLTAMGYSDEAVALCDADSISASINSQTPLTSLSQPAAFAGSNEKRNIIFFAADHLHKHTPQSADTVLYAELPSYAPFGEVCVDRQDCTLCMACVSVCPVAALEAGNDTPRLDFIENNCVQCGLCEIACPENVISRMPRFNFKQTERRQRRTLNEEAAFNCISCGKAFATRSVIEKMTAKLQNHAMFQDSGSIRRLQMCGDCRIRDMLEDENKLFTQ